MVPINYFAVFVAAVITMILGGIWYGPLFGKTWMKLSGITMTDEKIAEMKTKGGMWKNYLIAFIGALILCFAFDHTLIFASRYLNISGISAGLSAGFWNWLGFIATFSLGTVLWEGKSWKLWLFNNAYQLISFLLIGIILASWQ